MAVRSSDKPGWREVHEAMEAGYAAVAGVDEAGRGPLAGPVVAAAVVLPPDRELPGLADSKRLTPRQRQAMDALVRETALAHVVAVASASEVDSLNILRATHLAMRRALDALRPPADFAIVDGLPVRGLPVPHRAVVAGDARCAPVAAASVLAKVARDRMMVELDARWPGYGWARNKGYAAPEHLAALRRLGPCPEHRRSFAPVQRAGDQLQLPLGAPAAPGEETRYARGLEGERIAEAHLTASGWEIVARRYRAGGGEIDLVARRDGLVAFCEVKTGRGADSTPSEAVDVRKRERLTLAAEAFVAERGEPERGCRFDVIEVRTGPDGRAYVLVHEGAFEG